MSQHLFDYSKSEFYLFICSISCGIGSGIRFFFQALTVFGYAADFMGISSTASRQVLKNATEKTCATNWKEVSLINFLMQQCLHDFFARSCFQICI